MRYGISYLGVALVTQVVVQWVAYFYAPPAERGVTLIPMALVGIAMLIGRVVDALADPIVGVWSDNSRYSSGRRIPFIRYGMVPLCLTFLLIWIPFGNSDIFRFIYLTTILGFFFFFFTVVVAPYLALLPELASSVKERVSLSAWQGVFNIVGLAIAMVGSSWLISVHGFAVMGWILAIVALISFAITAFTVKEKPFEPPANTLGVIDSIILTVRNGPFRIFVFGQLLFWFGFNMAMIIIPYVVTVLMGLDEAMVGVVLGIALVVALASFPIVVKTSTKYGYKAVMIWTMALQAAVLVALGLIGSWPSVIGPTVQGFVTIALAGLPLAGLFVLPNAMLAEITDYDQRLTGRRREAIYFGVQGLALKSSIGLSSLVVTTVLNTFGYSVASSLGIRLSGPLAGLFVLIGMIVFRKYPENKVRDEGISVKTA